MKKLDKILKMFYNNFTHKKGAFMDGKREILPIAVAKTDFKEKFGIPRQSGRAPSLTAEIVFYPEYSQEEAVRGIEGFSHLWVLFEFSKAKDAPYSPTVRPPRLGGNTRVGVFASRSPYRPNRIGLSCVKLEQVKRTENAIVLVVSGADLVDGTPIYDIKPYLPFCDCVQDAVGGYADEQSAYKLQVDIPENLLEKLPKDKRGALCECLADDPRPSYQDEPERVYGMSFAGFEIKFKVNKNTLTVISVE